MRSFRFVCVLLCGIVAATSESQAADPSPDIPREDTPPQEAPPLTGRDRFRARFKNHPFFNGEPKLHMTTANAPAGYVVGTGTSTDGMVAVLTTTGGVTYISSGTLLPTGRHVLTAGHSITDANGDVLVGSTFSARFNLVGGQQSVAVHALHVPDEYDGDPGNGYDVGIIRLGSLAPTTETRYIYRGTSEINAVSQRTGYGASGTGNQGETAIAATHTVKRRGENRQEVFGEAVPGLGLAPGTQFIYDFDNSNAANDALGFLGLVSNTGVGANEVCGAGGDSGASTLIGNKIAGVHSWGLGFDNFPGTPDVTPGVTDASFGEIASDMRMSHYATWYDQVVPPVVRRAEARRINPTNFTYQIPTGSGEQIRSLPSGNITNFRFYLSEHVASLTGFAVTMRGMNGTYPGPSIGGAASGDEYEVSVTPSVPIQWTSGGKTKPSDALEFTLVATEFQKPVTSGALLDGDFTNPPAVGSTGTMTLPSGNGAPGTSFSFRVIVLPGDFNRDNKVDLSDQGILSANFGTGTTYAQGDADGDGDVDLSDFAFLKANFGIDWTTFPY